MASSILRFASSIDLVTQRRALDQLRDAEAHAWQGDYAESLALLSETFDGLLQDYADRKVQANGSSAYTWWAPQPFLATPLFARNHDQDLVKRVEYIYHSLGETQWAMRVLAMGLDYRRYARFNLLVPYVARFPDGRREVRWVPGLQVGADEYQFCKQFVIETALHLAETDFDLDVHSLVWEHRNRERATLADGSQTGY